MMKEPYQRLRWSICKSLNIPVDSNYFKRINEQQWAWYNAMYQQDEIEKFEFFRDIAEHNAMFQNSEGVRQIREARETSINVPDDEFEGQVKELFGRDIKLRNDNSVQDPEKVLRQNNMLEIYDDFDEVNFVPFGE